MNSRWASISLGDNIPRSSRRAGMNAQMTRRMQTLGDGSTRM